MLHYLGRRCTYCGRCADVCPEKAITMSEEFETATNQLPTWSSSSRCSWAPASAAAAASRSPALLDALKLKGYRVDDVEADRWVFRSRSSGPGHAVRDIEIEL